MAISPYEGVPIESWPKKTIQLVKKHPLNQKEIVEVVLAAWDDIFNSRLGRRGLRVGANVFPIPQIMGFLVHLFVPLELEQRHPGEWRGEQTAKDKDVVYIPDDCYSFEIKTSSSASGMYGNRSYAQKGKSTKKDKSGYYLAVNFSKFPTKHPRVTLIRFGWVDSTDWIGQHAPTGQQANIGQALNAKMLELYRDT